MLQVVLVLIDVQVSFLLQTIPPATLSIGTNGCGHAHGPRDRETSTPDTVRILSSWTTMSAVSERTSQEELVRDRGEENVRRMLLSVLLVSYLTFLDVRSRLNVRQNFHCDEETQCHEVHRIS